MTVVPAIIRRELANLVSSRRTVMLSLAACVFFGFVLSGSGMSAVVFFAPLLVGLGVAYFGCTQVFLREKIDSVIETLLCSPATLRGLWFGKTTAVTLFAGSFSLVLGLALLTAGTYAGSISVPVSQVLLYLACVLPLIVACLAGLRGFLQLLLGMRESQYVSLALLMAAMFILRALGVHDAVALTFSQVAGLGLGAAGVLVILGLSSRFLSAERVVTSL